MEPCFSTYEVKGGDGMEDAEIVALYWERDESAIRETDTKYGPFCRRIALNLLGVREDAEECVSDTYLAAWNAMPTQRPTLLRSWLGRAVRNLSVDRWRKNHAQKRYDGMEVLLSELDECVPSGAAAERAAEAREIGAAIERWLRTLSEEDRALFLRRYWNGDRLDALAKERGIVQNTLAQRMRRLRLSLKGSLEKEGIEL